jgi:hypothetical protein
VIVRIGQIVHLVGLVAIAAAYALVRSTLDSDDPGLKLVNAFVAVTLSVWAALVFIEYARTGQREGWGERMLAAYRRLLNRTATLVAIDILQLAAVCSLAYLLVGYRAIQIYAASDVEVMIDNPGKSPRHIGSVAAGHTSTFRLATGDQWLVFVDRGTGTPFYPRRLVVPPLWSHDEVSHIRIPAAKVYLDSR